MLTAVARSLAPPYRMVPAHLVLALVVADEGGAEGEGEGEEEGEGVDVAPMACQRLEQDAERHPPASTLLATEQAPQQHENNKSLHSVVKIRHFPAWTLEHTGRLELCTSCIIVCQRSSVLLKKRAVLLLSSLTPVSTVCGVLECWCARVHLGQLQS